MELRNKKAAIHNLGCKVNAYEAEAMASELREQGVEIVPWEEDGADIYIINTCSVTNIADRKSRQMIHKARSKNQEALVIAAGCYVQAKAQELKDDAGVDILLGNNEKGQLIEAIEAFYKAKRNPLGLSLVPLTGETNSFDKVGFVPEIRKEQRYETLAAGEISDNGRVFLKVQDGCNQFCSYCIIPYVRGKIRSRSVEDTLREVRDFASRGYHEMVLTGIHLSSYGLDEVNQDYEYVMNHDIPSTALLALIQAVAAVPGVERVRLGSLEPRVITKDFVEALKAIPEICPQFHLSLQSGDDKTLRRMNRHYDTASFRHSVKLLREAWPDAAITTDVIVGFPGETEEDFLSSYRFVEEIGFYELHVFKYSRRAGTVADRMPEQITDREKTRRSEKLIALDREKSDAFRRRFLGKDNEIVIEGFMEQDGREYLTGYNRMYVRFLVPFSDRVKAESKIGQIMKVNAREICKTCVLAMPMDLL